MGFACSLEFVSLRHVIHHVVIIIVVLVVMVGFPAHEIQKLLKRLAIVSSSSSLV